MFTRLTKIVFAALLLISAPAISAPITIDFEHFPGPDGKLGTADDTMSFQGWLRDQYSPIGLTFTQGTLFEAAFFDGNPSNHFISSTNPIAVLSVPVFGISIMSNSYWDATLTAYGAAGNIVALHRLEHGQPGSGPMAGVLSVTSSEAIASFSVLPDRPNYILNLDNLVLDVVEVPEPSHLLILGLGLLGLVTRSKRRPGNPA